MNVRRIVMMMLVLGCLVQGVGATSLTLEYPDGMTIAYLPDYGMPIGSTVYYSTHLYLVGNGTYGVKGWWLKTDFWDTPGEYIGWNDWQTTSDSIAINGSMIVSHSGVRGSKQVISFGAELPYPDLSTGIVELSSTPPSIATGVSCDGAGVYTIYREGVYMFEDDVGGNYSFPIFNNTNYSIYFSGTDEWHNFTATASDHTWNPTCSLPSISGTITALDGEGLYNLNVTLHDFYLYERDLVDSTFTDTNGSYNFYINDSADAGPYALSVSGYCNAGVDCSTFRIEAPINPGGESYIFDYTWHIPQNVRIDLQYENGSAVPGALLNMKNLPGDVGAWKTTATDGYTTYTSMQSSKIYVDYHGGDNYSGGPAGSDALHSFQLTPNGQYRRSQFTVTIPDDYTNNTTIPVIPPPVVDDGNKTDITDMVGDSLFLVTVRDSETSAPLKDATVTVVAADKLNYTGQWTGYTNTSGQWSFSKNYTVGEYDVSVQLKCYFPQTTTRRASATFDLVYSCGAPPGTDDNGTGGWKDNDSNSDWTFNNSMETENDVKNKLNSILYIVGVILVIILFATYFVKK